MLALEHLTNCPRCASDKQDIAFAVIDHSISQETFSLVDCAVCGFRFTNPRPDQSSVGRYYMADNYISHSNSAESIQDKLYQLARKWGLRKKYHIIHHLQPHGKVLDVGCGTGEFLAHLMSRGYLVQGVEPSLKAREQVIANHGISVMPALDLVPSQEQFQIVTLWHVLEHLPDLRATFKRLFALLADRGVLVIAVPDRGSWDANYYGRQWAAWDVPRHFSHFRQQDIHALLQEHGFKLVRTRRMWMDALYISMLSEGYCGSSKPWALLKGIVLGSWSNAHSALGGRPTSSSLYIARKVEP
jgi:SAM-dependent methyltransferase